MSLLAGPTGHICPVCSGPLGRAATYRQDRWGVFSCGECGHGVTIPAPEEQELQALYAQHTYFQERGMEAPAIRPADRVRAEVLRRQLGGRTLLDVGTGSGAFLAAAREVGYQVAGTEYSEVAAASARENFGLELRVGSFSAAQFEPGECFDVITMIHVLEHLGDPLEALALVRALLAPGGWAFIAVPNRMGLAARVPGPVARAVHDLPYHLNHFTPVSLRRALEVTGLVSVEAYASIPRPVERALAAASRVVRGLGRTAPAPGAAPEPGPAGGAPPARPDAGGTGTGRRLVELVRRTVPGCKVTAMGRRAG